MNIIDFPEDKYNDLAKVIINITKAMKADFGQQYIKQFSVDEDLRQYKRQLYSRMKGYNLQDIMNAYDEYVNAGNEFCPNIPALLKLVDAAAKSRRQSEANQAEALRIGNTQPTTRDCNPLAMLKDAREALKAKPQTKEERLAERLQALKAHHQLLELDKDKIKRHFVDAEHQCHVGYCDKPGSLSHGTTGKGNFYCQEHFQEF